MKCPDFLSLIGWIRNAMADVEDSPELGEW
jgi:hypothetical protein